MSQKISLQDFIQKLSGSQQSATTEDCYTLSKPDTGEVVVATGNATSLDAALDASQQNISSGTACTHLEKDGKSYLVEISRSFWEGQAYGQMSIDIKKNERWEDLYSIEDQEEYEFPLQDLITTLQSSGIDIERDWRGDISSSLDNPSYYS